jgi:hypothetical protein
MEQTKWWLSADFILYMQHTISVREWYYLHANLTHPASAMSRYSMTMVPAISPSVATRS